MAHEPDRRSATSAGPSLERGFGTSAPLSLARSKWVAGAGGYGLYLSSQGSAQTARLFPSGSLLDTMELPRVRCTSTPPPVPAGVSVTAGGSGRGAPTAQGHAPTRHRPRAACVAGRPLRVRVGDYRIIYTVADDVLLVVVVTVGHRRDVYDR